jgi:hypothetical protein
MCSIVATLGCTRISPKVERRLYPGMEKLS